jgi:hypothetical protein
MSELDIEIRELVREGRAAAEIAQALNIPAHWVTEIVEENEYNEMEARYRDEFFAEQCADADAEAYGNY